jgi:hypothetical protein
MFTLYGWQAMRKIANVYISIPWACFFGMWICMSSYQNAALEFGRTVCQALDDSTVEIKDLDEVSVPPTCLLSSPPPGFRKRQKSNNGITTSSCAVCSCRKPEVRNCAEPNGPIRGPLISLAQFYGHILRKCRRSREEKEQDK